MHPAIENFLARPKSHKIGFWVGSVVVLTFVFWQYFLSGTLKEFETQEKKVAELEKKVVDEKRRAANLPRLREMVKELEQKLNVALKELPDTREIPDLLDSLSGLARNSGLEVTLFKPGDEVFKDFYAEVPVSISVAGTFHQVTTFFDEVSHLDRIVNVNQIHMQTPQIVDNQVMLKVDCVALTFRYLDEAERAKRTEDDKGGAGKSGRKRR